MTLHPQGIAGASAQDAELNEFLRATNINLKVIGCGGAGKNTINTLSSMDLQGIELIGMNTDAQDLLITNSEKKILLGRDLTKGLGAGNEPDMGAKAAAESLLDIKASVEGADAVFITGGLGGGTGTGTIPIVAAEAKKLGVLTIAVVTLPFLMEGQRRWDNAMLGLNNLETNCDALILIPNQKLMQNCEDLPIQTAFKTADAVLANAIKGIVDLIVSPGLVNLDFADLVAVTKDSGVALIGTGDSDTEERAQEAIDIALNNPLLDADLKNAEGALVNISGGDDFTLEEADLIVRKLSEHLNPEAKIIWGAQVQPELGKLLKVLVVVTGLKAQSVVESHADAQGFLQFDEI